MAPGALGGPGIAAATPMAASRGLTDAASATTSPGNVALPTACEKKASRRSTTNAPATPPATASSASSSRARRVERSSTRSAGLGSAPSRSIPQDAKRE